MTAAPVADDKFADIMRQVMREEMRFIIHDEVEPLIRQIIREDVPILIHTAIQEDVPPLIHKAIQEEVPPIVTQIISREVPAIVQQETQDIREDIQLIRRVQTNQSSQLGRMEGDSRATKSELRRLGVLFEDLDYRLEAIGEAL